MGLNAQEIEQLIGDVKASQRDYNDCLSALRLLWKAVRKWQRHGINSTADLKLVEFIEISEALMQSKYGMK